MHSASETNLPILGAALLHIWVQLTGIETRQMDFSSMATKLYLSLATCADLGLILKEFPFSTLMPPEGDSQASGATPGSHPTYYGPADHADPPPLLGPPSCPPTPPTGNGQARARGPMRMLTPLQELQGGGRCQVYQATHSGQHWTRRSPKRPVPSGPPDTGMSPANCLIGRSTRDLLLGIPAKYRPHQDWTDRLDLHERALSKKRVTGRARWDKHSQGLSPLRCGDAVMIQNQTGRHQTKWDKSGSHGGTAVPSIRRMYRRVGPTHYQKPTLPQALQPSLIASKPYHPPAATRYLHGTSTAPGRRPLPTSNDPNYHDHTFRTG